MATKKLIARGPNGGFTSPYLESLGKGINEKQKEASRGIKRKIDSFTTPATKSNSTRKPMQKTSTTKLKKADVEMTKVTAPYKKAISDLKSDRKKISSTRINPNENYYNTKVYNQHQEIKKIDKQIKKTTKQMENKKQEVKNARANGQKLLRKQKA